MGTGEDAPGDYAQRRAKLEWQLNGPDGYDPGPSNERVFELERLDRLIRGEPLPDMSELLPGWEWALASNERIPKWRATTHFPLGEEEVQQDEVISLFYGFWERTLGHSWRYLIPDAEKAGALEPLAVDIPVLPCACSRRFRTLVAPAAHGCMRPPEDAADESGEATISCVASPVRRGRFPSRQALLAEVKLVVEQILEGRGYPARERVAEKLETSESTLERAHQAFGYPTWETVLAEVTRK